MDKAEIRYSGGFTPSKNAVIRYYCRFTSLKRHLQRTIADLCPWKCWNKVQLGMPKYETTGVLFHRTWKHGTPAYLFSWKCWCKVCLRTYSIEKVTVGNLIYRKSQNKVRLGIISLEMLTKLYYFYLLCLWLY